MKASVDGKIIIVSTIQSRQKESGRSVPNEAYDVKIVASIASKKGVKSLDQHAIDLCGKKETSSADPDTHWWTHQCDFERLDRVKRFGDTNCVTIYHSPPFRSMLEIEFEESRCR